MRLPPPVTAGKCRVKEMALAVEWLPEEWPDGIPSLKQLLVVAPLTTSILLPFRTEITTFAACGPMPVVHMGFCLFLHVFAAPSFLKNFRFSAPAFHFCFLVSALQFLPCTFRPAPNPPSLNSDQLTFKRSNI